MKITLASQNIRGLKKKNLINEDKLGEICHQISSHKIFAACLQETWLSNNFDIDIDNYKFLHAGLEPQDNSRRGSQGVAIVLNPEACKAWENANYTVHRFGARIIAARLTFNPTNQQPNIPTNRSTNQSASQNSSNNPSTPKGIFIISAYAPQSIHDASTWDNFFDNLNACIQMKDKNDILFIGSDTNSSIGTLGIDQNPIAFSGVGQYGLQTRNPSGERFLSYLNREGLVAASTFFSKPIHKYRTWIHPNGNIPYQIDHIITQKDNLHHHFTNVSTGKHLAESDHWPLYANINIQSTSKIRSKHFKKSQQNILRQFDYSALNSATTVSNLCQSIISHINNITDENAHQKLTNAIPLAIAETLPKSNKKKDKEWFKMFKNELEPSINLRNNIYKLYQSAPTYTTKRILRHTRARICKLVKDAKNKWINNVARNININSKKSNFNTNAWEAIKTLKKGLTNTRKTNTIKLRKPDGSLCNTPNDNADIFHNHFNNLFQAAAPTDPSLLNDLEQLNIQEEGGEIPSDTEIMAAIKKLNNTSPGISGINSSIWKTISTNQEILAHIKTSKNLSSTSGTQNPPLKVVSMVC